jgi:hypothetical protein
MSDHLSEDDIGRIADRVAAELTRRMRVGHRWPSLDPTPAADSFTPPAAPPTARIAATLDTSAFDSALVDLTAEFSDPILEVVYRLVCSPQVFPRLFRFDRDRLAAARTPDEQRILLQPTDGYRNLVVALRALERGGLVIKEAGHP